MTLFDWPYLMTSLIAFHCSVETLPAGTATSRARPLISWPGTLAPAQVSPLNAATSST
nr:hypothetical protein [Saccharothrix australiensis]